MVKNNKNRVNSNSADPGKGFNNRSIKKTNKSIYIEKKVLTLINERKFGEAVDIYRKMILIGKNKHIYYRKLAVLYGMRDDNEEIIKLLNCAIQEKPDYPEAHNELGIAYKSKGDLNSAIISYKRAISYEPKCSEFYFNLGTAYLEQAELTPAIETFKRAIKFKSN